MKIYMSVDCGGSKTDCVLFDSLGQVISEKRVYGGTNLRTLGEQKVKENIEKCLLEIKSSLGENEIECVYGYFMHNEATFAEYCGKILGCDKTVPIEEGTLALYCAGIYPSGIVLLSGTGADAFLIQNGKTVEIIGGYGAYLGDDGSGYHMGREGINAACAYYERRGDKTILLDMLREKYKADTLRKSVYKIIGSPEPIKEIAAFSHVVEQAVDAGDDVAKKIYYMVASSLSDYVISACLRYSLSDDFPLTITGGILRSDAERKKPLLIPMIEIMTNKKIIRPTRKPSHGGIEYHLRNN